MDTQTVCRICKMEGIRLHCITNTYLQQIYEHDSGTSQYSNTNMSATSSVEHHNNTCVVQSDAHKCIKMETEHFIEIEVKEEFTTDAEADETWQENEVSLKEDNDNTEMGLSPRIVNVKSENDIMDGTGPGDITTHRRVTRSQTYEDKTCHKTEEESTRESCDEVTFNYNNDACELEHLVKRDTGLSKRKPRQKQFECDTCNKRFNVKGSLLTHIRIHTGDKPYECTICNKFFNHKSNLDAHNRIHTGDKPFECNVCNKRFTQKGSLTIHNRLHTRKPYECNICNNCFSKKSDLVKHSRLHTGEKPYKCNVCNNCFIKKSELVQHNRIHTGDKPFKCNICNKCFTQSGSLVIHNRIHTG